MGRCPVNKGRSCPARMSVLTREVIDAIWPVDEHVVRIQEKPGFLEVWAGYGRDRRQQWGKKLNPLPEMSFAGQKGPDDCPSVQACQKGPAMITQTMIPLPLHTAPRIFH